MQTNIGQVSWYDDDNGGNFLDCDLELNDYVANLVFDDGSRIEIKVSGTGIYNIEEEDREYFKAVSVKNDSGDTVNLFLINPDQEFKIERMKNHYYQLNRIYLYQQDNFSKKVNEKYIQIVNENHEIKRLVHNFIERTDRFLFIERSNIICFERYLLFKYGIGRLSVKTFETNSSLLTINSIIEGFEGDVELDKLTDYYDESFIKLVKIIGKKVNFETDAESVFVVWILLLNEVINYYYEMFNNEYGMFISNVETQSLDDCIKSYSSIDIIDVNLVSNASIFTYYLMYLEKFHENNNFLDCYGDLVDKLLIIIENKGLDDFETSLMETSTTSEFTIEDVDLMSGQEFENFISHLFRKMGYSSEVTKTSGDQGIDVIVEKNGKRIGIQTKCYSNTVSNKAIQEVVAGIKYYQLTKGIVITNNYFTESAKILAHSNEVVIWDRSILKEKISEVF